MRIISKFKDYYDGAMAYGQDTSVVYARETREVRYEPPNPSSWSWEAALEAVGVKESLSDALYEERYELLDSGGVEIGALCFCGRLYPFLVLAPDLDEEAVVFSWDKDFEDYLDPPRRGNAARLHWREAVAASTGADCVHVNLQHRSPIVMLTPGLEIPGPYHAPRWIIDPCLRDFGFQRIVDAFAAFQEIAMFVGGVLVESPDPPSPQTDPEKVRAHGFDPVYGFRKPPKA